MLYNLGRIPPIAPSNPKQDPEVKETTAKKKPKPTKPPIANHREKKEKKKPPRNQMSNFLWNAQSIAYVLREFDGGRSAAQIHNEFVHAGYNVLLGTIEQTLRVNGRNVDGFNPLDRPTYISNSYGTPGNRAPAYSQPGNQVTHQHLVRNDNYAGTWVAQGNRGVPPPSTPTNFAPQSSHGRHWDFQAARFAIEAHRSGQSVLQIWSDLRRRGYVVNAAEVAASLNAQGVSGVHVVDYLGR